MMDSILKFVFIVAFGIVLLMFGRLVYLELFAPKPKPPTVTEPTTVVIEPPILIEGFPCYRRGELTVNVEDYEVIVTAVCSMELLDAYYIALIPEK